MTHSLCGLLRSWVVATYSLMTSIMVTKSREDSQISLDIKLTFIFILWLVFMINMVLVGLLGNSKLLFFSERFLPVLF